MGSFGSNHKTFVANFVDPAGFFGGKKGFLGLGENKNEARDRKAAADASRNQGTPSVLPADQEETDRLKRIGRASLITSSSRGVLDNAGTSSRKLFGV